MGYENVRGYIALHIKTVFTSSSQSNLYGLTVHLMEHLKKHLFVCIPIRKTSTNLVVATPLCGFINIRHTSAQSNQWLISLRREYNINATFLYFFLPNTGQNCIACHVRVFEEGNTTLDNVYCGQRVPWNVYSTSGKHVYLLHYYQLPAVCIGPVQMHLKISCF